MTTILLTGFEPFGGDASNPSGDAVRLVASNWTGPERLVTAVRRLALLNPETGLAGNRAMVSVERVAVNLTDARIPDNAGMQPVDGPSVDGAPAAYFATIPVKAIARDIAAAGIPSEVSHSAGTFVCNHAFFTAVHVGAQRPGTRAGFIHVPWGGAQSPADARPPTRLV